MAGKLRYFKEQGGSFYTRIAVPRELQAVLGKTQLQVSLGTDRRNAEKRHHAEVAELQAQITSARRQAAQAGAVEAKPCEFPLSAEQIALSHYRQRLSQDDKLRDVQGYAQVGVDDRVVQALRDGIAGKLEDKDLEAMVGVAIEHFRTAGNHDAQIGTSEWRRIAKALCAAEYEALERVVERDEGNISGTPKNPMLANSVISAAPVPALPIKELFRDYLRARQAIGKHRDDGANWARPISDLVGFLGHGDARRITKKDLLNWRDSLILSGKSAKTVSNKYLAAIRAILRWAHENELLPSNEAEAVRQEVPRRSRTRERGYTTPEATKLLCESAIYAPIERKNPANRESAHITAAKRWIPWLCAFSGARVSEAAQLRKQDIWQDGDLWVMRLTADAGSLKSGDYRDVPLHAQIIELGFLDFLKGRADAPLFHTAKQHGDYLKSAQITAARVAKWLQDKNLVPEGVQPNHAWRHRFKTQGRELGISDRVIDAIQGHAGRTAGDSYGDVTLKTRIDAIGKFPHYVLK